MMSFHRILVAVGVSACLAVGSWMPVCQAQEVQPIVLIEVAGQFMVYVPGVAGIGSESEVVEYKVIGEGGVEIIQKIPGRLKYLDITLERGIASNLDLAEWRKLVEEGLIESARADIVVTAINPAYEPVASWSGSACWPSRIENLLPDPASATGALVEKLTIVCEGLERTQ